MIDDAVAVAPPPVHRPRVGLVLGGGGAVGAAYHAGALAALEHDLGWDARHADVVVGTSAGALVGALLRLDVPATDLAALSVGAATHSASKAMADWVLDRPSFAPISVGHILRAPRMPGPAMLLGLAKVALGQRQLPLSGLSMFLPDGRELIAPHLELLDKMPSTVPFDEPLLVCAVRRRDWRRTVFDSRDPAVQLSAALAASCAVPGYFADVCIHGDTYVDGGAISATNADVLRRHDLDLVIVISPMSGAAHWPSASHIVSQLCRRTLDRELRALRRHSIPAVVIQPGADVTRHMPIDFMRETASRDIVQSAFLDTGAQIASSVELRNLRLPRAA